MKRPLIKKNEIRFLLRHFKKIKIYFFLILLFFSISCFWGVLVAPKDEYHKVVCRSIFSNFNGPYRGKVIDYETDEPIKDAIVIFWWFERYYYNNGMSFEKVVRIEKVKTGKEGEFFIEKINFKRDICFPKFLVYKKDFIEINLYRKLFKKNDLISFSSDCCIRSSCECIFYLKRLNEKEKKGLLDGIYQIPIPEEILNLIKEEDSF